MGDCPHSQDPRTLHRRHDLRPFKLIPGTSSLSGRGPRLTIHGGHRPGPPLRRERPHGLQGPARLHPEDTD